VIGVQYRISGIRAVAALAFALCACGLAPAQTPTDPGHVNLLSRLPVALVSRDAGAIGEIPVDANEYFAGGWYQASPSESGRVYRWMGPRAGAIDLPLAAQRELAVEVGLAVPRGPQVPAFAVRFYWNGAFIGGALLDKQTQTVKMTVPAASTRIGRNRLEIIPSFWVNASRLAGGSSDSNVSVNLFLLKIADSTAGAPKASLPEPPRSAGTGIEQSASTVITLYEAVPKGARLAIAGRWSNRAPSAGAEAIAVVTTSSGETRQLARFVPGENAQRIEPSLTELSDQELAFAEVSLVVRQPSDAAAPPAVFEWTELALTADAPAPAPKAPALSSRPNVILYVIDTLRASYLEPYGATRVHTPHFSALAKQGVTFLSALAHTSWTRPSIVTLLTSQYETTHGTTTMEHMLANAVPYLPETLRDAGYRTAAISMNGHIAPQWGFGRGFDSFARINTERTGLLAPPEPRAYVDKLWAQYIAPGIARDTGPFFLYLHELDPHGPYTPPAPFDAMYPTHYRGQPEVEADHIALVRTGLTELEPEDIAFLETRYRGEVSFIDAVLGSLVERLKAEGLAENTLLVVVSDHGEEFGEHGGIGHSVTLYEEMLRVPMIWAWPDQVKPDRRDDTPIGLIDLAPTLLSLLGISIPAEMRGQDMAAAVRGTADRYAPRPLFAYKSDQPGRALQSVHYGPWKLIERMWGPMSTFELFNLEDDPGEVTNRWIGEAIVGGALRQAMAWERHTSGPAAATELNKLETLDPETIEQLRNLGYVQ